MAIEWSQVKHVKWSKHESGDGHYQTQLSPCYVVDKFQTILMLIAKGRSLTYLGHTFQASVSC